MGARVKMRLIAAILCCLLLLPAPAASAAAQPATHDLLEGILQSLGASSGEDALQALIDGKWSAEAGVGSEWIIFALAQHGRYDFSAWEQAMLAYLDTHTVRSASSRLKYALCLAAVGSEDAYITRTADDSIGQQGVMSLVFGLHLLTNGIESNMHDIPTLLAAILALQNDDGGFAVIGTQSQVDATAMTVQALAPHRLDASVGEAIDRALLFLSGAQRADGSYVAYGVPNPESGAQVMIALAALGIDAGKDDRFIKEGGSLLDAIMTFRLPDGSFCHTPGGERNATATAQVLLAMVAEERREKGDRPLYLIDARTNLPETDTADAEISAPEVTDRVSDREEETATNGTGDASPGILIDVRLWVSLILFAAWGVICLLLGRFGKGNAQNRIVLLVLILLAVCAVWLIDIQSPEDYYRAPEETKDVIGTVTLSIGCGEIAGRSDHIPKDGVILPETEIAIAEGDTVYTVLMEAAKRHRILIDHSGTAEMAYISGIASICELDFGDLSGWVYTVNGVQPSLGASACRLADGDRIEWSYTLTLGGVWE